jgi:hypothetical protein
MLFSSIVLLDTLFSYNTIKRNYYKIKGVILIGDNSGMGYKQKSRKKKSICFIYSVKRLIFPELITLYHGIYRIIYIFLRERAYFYCFTEITDKIFYRITQPYLKRLKLWHVIYSVAPKF